MNSRRVLALVLFLLSVTLVGCGSKGGGGGSARIRVLNAIPDANAISVRLDNDAPIVSGLPFEQVTQYTGVNTGSREFKVSVNGGASNVIDTTLNVNGADYTYVVYGPVSAALSGLVADSGFTTPSSGNSRPPRF